MPESKLIECVDNLQEAIAERKKKLASDYNISVQFKSPQEATISHRYFTQDATNLIIHHIRQCGLKFQISNSAGMPGFVEWKVTL